MTNEDRIYMYLGYDISIFRKVIKLFHYYKFLQLLTSNSQVRFDLLWFHDISTIVGYLMPNLFVYIKQFYFKQFSSA